MDEDPRTRINSPTLTTRSPNHPAAAFVSPQRVVVTVMASTTANPYTTANMTGPKESLDPNRSPSLGVHPRQH
jgi:hypothetical protein